MNDQITEEKPKQGLRGRLSRRPAKTKKRGYFDRIRGLLLLSFFVYFLAKDRILRKKLERMVWKPIVSNVPPGITRRRDWVGSKSPNERICQKTSAKIELNRPAITNITPKRRPFSSVANLINLDTPGFSGRSPSETAKTCVYKEKLTNWNPMIKASAA